MIIAVGADHAGYLDKDRIAARLREDGHTVLDFGTHDATAVDYPDYGFAVGEAVAAGRAERGILVCGSAIGIGIAANKVPGIRCAAPAEPFAAEMSRRHNDANVLALGQRMQGWELIERIISVFLATPFDGGRHAGRVAKLAYSTAQRAKTQADVARRAVTDAETPKDPA